MFYCHFSDFFLSLKHKFLRIHVGAHCSLARSRSELIGIIVSQLCVGLVTINGYPLERTVTTNVISLCTISMLTAGMSSRGVVHELNVHFTTVSNVFCSSFVLVCNRSQNWKSCVTTPAQDAPSGFIT